MPKLKRKNIRRDHKGYKNKRRDHKGTLVPLKGGIIREPWFP
jgi:hypothetical protein